MNDVKYLTVSALTNYIKYRLENDPHLSRIFLKGEISNFTRHQRGHLYFTIKDDKSQIKSVMFSSRANNLNFNPKDGDHVLIEGEISLYEPRGEYSLNVGKMTLDGVGELYLKYEKLKNDLEKLGYFSEELKKALPKFPKKIGVITSPTGAVIEDIKNTVTRRYLLAEIYLYPTKVQGEDAKFEIANQIKRANQDNLVDVIILGRGGGSIEDLWAFNEIEVINAIYSSKIPIVTAIGHETDYTISDFVSDKRAPTPTAAAELVTPNRLTLKENIMNSAIYIVKLYSDKVDQLEFRLAQLEKRLDNASPIKRVTVYQNDLLKVENDLVKSYLYLIEKKTNSLKQLKLSMKNPLSLYKELSLKHQILNQKLNLSYQQLINIKNYQYQLLISNLKNKDPLIIMNKGFGLVTKNDKVIVSIHQINLKDELEIKIKDGSIKAIVKEKREK